MQGRITETWTRRAHVHVALPGGDAGKDSLVTEHGLSDAHRAKRRESTATPKTQSESKAEERTATSKNSSRQSEILLIGGTLQATIPERPPSASEDQHTDNSNSNTKTQGRVVTSTDASKHA